MDGHGSHGHFISNSVKALFSEYIFKASHYGLNINSSNNTINNNSSNYKNIYSQNQQSNSSVNLSNLNTIHSKIIQNDYNLVKRCFQHCEATLAKSKYEVNFSGTTAIMVIQIDDVLICGNAGDSRAIVKTTEGIKPLSLDHKPDNDDERRRIVAAGGRVEKFCDNGEFIGPYRVWLKYEDYPGLAMSRSLGDFVSKSVGCSCVPEVIELKINSNYEFMVLASDGVWEFLDNEAVCKIVQPYYNKNDPDGAVNKLIEEASRMWKIVSLYNFMKIYRKMMGKMI
jgi:serine/threonine protein phosphatase PrpC